MKKWSSTPILTSLVEVCPRNIHTKFEANLCSGLREVEIVQSLFAIWHVGEFICKKKLLK